MPNKNYTDSVAWRNMGSVDRIKYRQFRAEFIAKDKSNMATPPSPAVWMRSSGRNKYSKQFKK